MLLLIYDLWEPACEVSGGPQADECWG